MSDVGRRITSQYANSAWINVLQTSTAGSCFAAETASWGSWFGEQVVQVPVIGVVRAMADDQHDVDTVTRGPSGLVKNGRDRGGYDFKYGLGFKYEARRLGSLGLRSYFAMVSLVSHQAANLYEVTCNQLPAPVPMSGYIPLPAQHQGIGTVII